MTKSIRDLSKELIPDLDINVEKKKLLREILKKKQKELFDEMENFDYTNPDCRFEILEWLVKKQEQLKEVNEK